MYGDEVNTLKLTPLDEPKSVGQQIIDGLKEAIEAERANKHSSGYGKCPNCGQETLVYEDCWLEVRLGEEAEHE